jgi:hypothetical protein
MERILWNSLTRKYGQYDDVESMARTRFDLLPWDD